MPGSQDITIDVPFDQLPEPDALRSQSQFLQRWGIDELVDEGVRVWNEQAARPGLEAMRMRSRCARPKPCSTRPASAPSTSPNGVAADVPGAGRLAVHGPSGPRGRAPRSPAPASSTSTPPLRYQQPSPMAPFTTHLSVPRVALPHALSARLHSCSSTIYSQPPRATATASSVLTRSLHSPRLSRSPPLIDRAAAFIDDASGLLRRGTLVCIDYGVPRTGELAMRPWREWLRTYRSNERGGHYLADAGGQDITIDVPFDQLPEPDALRSQSQFLQRWGIDELVDEGVRVWNEQAARPGLEAMRMRSRVREAEALLDATGLGAFHVAEWRRG